MPLDYNLVLILVTIVGVGIASCIGILKIYYMKEDRKPKFSYERVKENDKWHIMILHPDKIIHKLSISINGKQIPVKNSQESQYELTLRAGEGENFAVPDTVQDDSIVIIKYDKYHKKMKYKDIPLYRYSSRL